MPRKKFFGGNWKMYTNLSEARNLAAAVVKGLAGDDRTTVVLCPPFPWLLPVAEVLKGTGVGLGGQNVHFASEGAYTGDVSAKMLLEAGCQYVIVGHSERRHGLHEPDMFLNKKVKAALAAGLKVIYCIGETLAERESNIQDSVLEFQLAAGLVGLPRDQVSRLIVAYEPVWAIGTGKNATPQQAQDAHKFIRTMFAKHFGEATAQELIVIYGGSVKPDNAAEIMKQPDVDGGLIGGASLKADSFLAIVRAGLVQ